MLSAPFQAEWPGLTELFGAGVPSGWMRMLGPGLARRVAPRIKQSRRGWQCLTRFRPSRGQTLVRSTRPEQAARAGRMFPRKSLVPQYGPRTTQTHRPLRRPKLRQPRHPLGTEVAVVAQAGTVVEKMGGFFGPAQTSSRVRSTSQPFSTKLVDGPSLRRNTLLNLRRLSDAH